MSCLTFASLTQRLQKLLKVLRGLHSPLARKIRNCFLHVDAGSRRCIFCTPSLARVRALLSPLTGLCSSLLCPHLRLH